MTDVALVTYQKLLSLSPSDQLLVAPLVQRGIHPVAVPWDDPDVDWQQFEAVILRSCWDYHHRPDEFRQWVTKLNTLNIPLHNPPQTVLWNMEKTYLRGLAEYGIRTIPTVWISQNEKPRLAELLASRNLHKAVLKPAIGASAYGVQVVSSEDAEGYQAVFEHLLESSAVMIQPVVEEIKDGELSLVFFRHAFSYAIRKMPGNDSIFVNSAYGGARQSIEVPSQIVQTAQTVLDTASRLTGSACHLYARVDGVMVDGEFVLMELELIEPGLLLDVVPPHGTADFVQAIVKNIS